VRPDAIALAPAADIARGPVAVALRGPPL